MSFWSACLLLATFDLSSTHATSHTSGSAKPRTIDFPSVPDHGLLLFCDPTASCVWSYRLGWRCETTVLHCRCVSPICWGSRFEGAPAESPIPVLQSLPIPWSTVPGMLLECDLFQTLEKRGEKWDLPICLVVCSGRRLGYCNAQNSCLSSPGSLYKPVELLWSSTSDSLRKIKWSTMRG